MIVGDSIQQQKNCGLVGPLGKNSCRICWNRNENIYNLPTFEELKNRNGLEIIKQ